MVVSPSAPAGSPRTAARRPVGVELKKTPKKLTASLLLGEGAPAGAVHEEDLFRAAIEAQEATEYIAVAMQLQESVLSRLETGSTKHHCCQEQLDLQHKEDHELLISTHATSCTLQVEVEGLKAAVAEHIAMQSAEDRRRLLQLEQENFQLRHELGAAKTEVERRAAEMQGLRDTLSRRLIRTSVENDMIRQDVRARIAQSSVDLVAMQKQLHEGIEAAVLKFHKPQFEGALRSLQEITQENTAKLQQQSIALHSVIDSVGASDITAEVKTIHSNLPAVYRKQLGLLSKEKLLSLLDVLSFEDEVVNVIGRALYAHDPLRSQEVFT